MCRFCPLAATMTGAVASSLARCLSRATTGRTGRQAARCRRESRPQALAPQPDAGVGTGWQGQCIGFSQLFVWSVRTVHLVGPPWNE